MPRRILTLVLLLGLTVAACDSSDPAADEQRTLRLTFSGLDALANGFHYEGWAIIDGSPVSTGKFNADASGALMDLQGGAIAGGAFDTGTDLRDASAIVITIEPTGDNDAVPAATKFLGGDMAGARAGLDVAHGASLGDDFISAAGRYILATPTDGPDSDETSGLWFLDASSGAPQAGLTLPTLPDGWAYEGWIVINGTPVTTGRFTSVSGADEAAPFSGPNAAPPFPGEDLLMNAPAGLSFPLDLSESTAVISIEPSPDDSPAPFTPKPLIGAVPVGAKSGTVYSMDNNAAVLPTGVAEISR